MNRFAERATEETYAAPLGLMSILSAFPRVPLRFPLG